MREITGDLFEPYNQPDAICITTNGVIKRNGSAVMGAGCAKQARIRWPGIESHLATGITLNGNVCNLLTYVSKGEILLPGATDVEELHYRPGYHVTSFPTKDHWKKPSELSLITKSALYLVEMTHAMHWETVVLPRPGCGLGQLSWEDEVRPTLEPILDDRFHIITFGR